MKLSTAWSTTILVITGSSSSHVDAFQPIVHTNRASRTSQSKFISQNDPNSRLPLQLQMASKEATVDKELELRSVSLFNSLTNQKDPFTPLSQSKAVSMYTCGPTVYDYAHVGNFRAFLTYDVLKRALSYFDYEVDHICNLTDVDDKIIAKCTREDRSLLDVTRTYERKFMEDLEALNISHPWWLTRDTATYLPFMKKRPNNAAWWPRKLKELAKEKLDREIQAYGRPHSSIEDAIAAIDLYKTVQTKWEGEIYESLVNTNKYRQQKYEAEHFAMLQHQQQEMYNHLKYQKYYNLRQYNNHHQSLGPDRRYYYTQRQQIVQ